MSSPDPDLPLDLDLERLPALPPGAPVDFWERLVRHLKTDARDTLEAAAADYRGVWASAHGYVVGRVSEQLPPILGWLLAICDPDQLRRGYEAGRLILWTVPLSGGRCMVFESVRAEIAGAEPLAGPDPGARVAEDPPCPVCGALHWDRFFHSADDQRPLGCDRCRPDLA